MGSSFPVDIHQATTRGQLFPSRYPPGYNTWTALSQQISTRVEDEDSSFQTDIHQATRRGQLFPADIHQATRRGQLPPRRYPPGYNTISTSLQDEDSSFPSDIHQTTTRGQLFPSRYPLGYNTRTALAQQISTRPQSEQKFGDKQNSGQTRPIIMSHHRKTALERYEVMNYRGA